MAYQWTAGRYKEGVGREYGGDNDDNDGEGGIGIESDFEKKEQNTFLIFSSEIFSSDIFIENLSQF